MQATNLTEYLDRYGALIAERTKTSFAPLHVPARDKPLQMNLKRKPFDAQAHAVTAIVKGWSRNKCEILCAEQGTGKTLMGIVAAHGHARGRPYRALVFAPDHLVGKWAREINQTLHGVSVRRVKCWHDVTKFKRCRPTGAEWTVIGRNMSKWSVGWRPAYRKDRWGVLHCPRCGGHLVKKCDKQGEATFWTKEELASTKRYCQNEVDGRVCGEALWQWGKEPKTTKKKKKPKANGKWPKWKKWPPATYIHRHLQGYFRYVIIDECHEEASADSAQANAAGALVASCEKALALTGTLLNGYADSVQPMLFRLSPKSVVSEGLTWSNQKEFIRRYGRLDVTYTERTGPSVDNRNSRGRKSSKNERRQPGIMPTLYGRHLIGNTVFLSLEEVAANLPKPEETPVPVDMGAELTSAYRHVEEALVAEVREMLRRGNKQLLGTMLQALLAYPDYPYDWDEIGYKTGDEWKPVVTPRSLDKDKLWPKEKKLLEILRKEKAEGRQVWVYVQYTDRHPVLSRLEHVISKAGFKVKALRQDTVPLSEREEWIHKNAPGLDVVISHPKLVETGLDLFDKDNWTFNFPSILFYETGYVLPTMRQASRRAWRIGQPKKCRMYYLYYSGTMQDKAMALMGKKLKASLTLEGKFSSEGLVALSGDEGSAEMELAKSLAERIDFGTAERVWQLAGDMPELDDDWQEMDDWIAEVQAEAERRKAEKARRNAEILAKLDELFDDWDDDLPGGRSAPITEVAAA